MSSNVENTEFMRRFERMNEIMQGVKQDFDPPEDFDPVDDYADTEFPTTERVVGLLWRSSEGYELRIELTGKLAEDV